MTPIHRRRHRLLAFAGALTLMASAAAAASLQDAPQSAPPPSIGPADTTQVAGSAIVVDGDTLFVVAARVGSFSAAERAAAIQLRLDGIIRDPFAVVDSVRVVPDSLSGALDLVAADVVLMTVTPADAALAGTTSEALAATLAGRFATTLQDRSVSLNRQAILLGILYSILATAALVFLIRFLNGFFPKLYRLLGVWRTTRIPNIRFQGLEIITAERIYQVLLGLVTALRWVVTLLLLYFFVPLVLSFFPWTRNMADQLVGWIVDPFARAFAAIISYIPNVFAILVIIVVTYWVLRAIKLVFDALENGTIHITGFYPDWAEPTFKLVRFMAVALAIVLIWPYLPANDSDQFKGVAAFLGLLISLGSASAVGNIMGGVIMVYMRPFQVGDHVKIADTVGDVVSKTLLATRIRTHKNVDITIPNAQVLGSHIVNYSSTARTGGVILHTTVTLGYDLPWRMVHETLIAAASATPGVWPDPEPFVLQRSLDDFYVAYELNAYTDQANRMPRLYSALHQNIQDYCAAAGIEILSPHYKALRDGNQNTIPAPHLPDDYQVPPFRVSVMREEAPAPGQGKAATPPRDDRQMDIF